MGIKFGKVRGVYVKVCVVRMRYFKEGVLVKYGVVLRIVKFEVRIKM